MKFTKISLFILIVLMSMGLTAQTKMIAHKSHSGSPATIFLTNASSSVGLGPMDYQVEMAYEQKLDIAGRKILDSILKLPIADSQKYDMVRKMELYVTTSDMAQLASERDSLQAVIDAMIKDRSEYRKVKREAKQDDKQNFVPIIAAPGSQPPHTGNLLLWIAALICISGLLIFLGFRRYKSAFELSQDPSVG